MLGSKSKYGVFFSPLRQQSALSSNFIFVPGVSIILKSHRNGKGFIYLYSGISFQVTRLTKESYSLSIASAHELLQQASEKFLGIRGSVFLNLKSTVDF